MFLLFLMNTIIVVGVLENCLSSVTLFSSRIVYSRFFLQGN